MLSLFVNKTKTVSSIAVSEKSCIRLNRIPCNSVLKTLTDRSSICLIAYSHVTMQRTLCPAYLWLRTASEIFLTNFCASWSFFARFSFLERKKRQSTNKIRSWMFGFWPFAHEMFVFRDARGNLRNKSCHVMVGSVANWMCNIGEHKQQFANCVHCGALELFYKYYLGSAARTDMIYGDHHFDDYPIFASLRMKTGIA